MGSLARPPRGTNRDAIARLNVDGSVDASFDVVPEAPVLSLAVQPDGKMVVGGYFSVLNGEPHKRLGRLNADGSVDSDFIADANYLVTSLALQADGKILVGGDFTTLGEQSRTNLPGAARMPSFPE